MFEQFKARQTQKALLRNPVVSFALEEWDRRVNDKNVEGKFSDALKQRSRSQLIDTLSQIVQAEKPFMKMHEQLADAVVITSNYNVLVKHRIDQYGNPFR
jgi:hypothetical protein